MTSDRGEKLYVKKPDGSLEEVGFLYEGSLYDVMSPGHHLVHVHERGQRTRHEVQPEFVPTLVALDRFREEIEERIHEIVQTPEGELTPQQARALEVFLSHFPERQVVYRKSIHDMLTELHDLIAGKVAELENHNPAVQQARERYRMLLALSGSEHVD